LLGVGGSKALKVAIIPIIIAYITSAHPAVLNISIDSITVIDIPNKIFLVKGTVEMKRHSNIWTDPESMYWFNQWWQSTEGKQKFHEDSHGLLELLSIEWRIVEERPSSNSDVLGFTAIVNVMPRVGLGKTPFAPIPQWR